MLSSIIHERLHLFQRSAFHMCVSTKSSISLSSRPRTVACKRKLLLVKNIHIKQQIKKMDVIKKEYCHLLCMRNKQNGFTNMRGNRIVNMLVPVLHTRLWMLHQMLEHHFVEYIPPIQPPRCTEVWNPFKIPCPSSLEVLFLSHIYFFISFESHTTNHTTYMV
jgi:hypothetical protein